jgi:methionyl-tRNA synthetase
MQPWDLVKSLPEVKDPEQEKAIILSINQTVFNCAEAIRVVGILLQPYMPGKAAQLLDMLGVNESNRTFAHAKLGADFTYGTARIPLGKCAWDGLFPPLSVET